MKLTGNGESITTNIEQTRARKCGVKAGAAAWKIMTDNLYAYKERAIIRELSTNCIDSLRKAGKPLNDWVLTLPNSSSNLLIFEDHGIGMDENDIGVYTTLFDSTKSDSNDETGMFGLGAKTPFAYTKQFMVESSKNGLKNIYDIHIAEDGCPDCVKINPEPIPTDKTGTKITLVIKNEDYEKFYEGLAFSAVTWPGLPVLNGADDFYYWLKRRYYFSDSGENALKATNLAYTKSKVVDNDSTYSVGGRFTLEMGSVLYKISIDPNFSLLPNTRYVIHANIGDVDIQPSREELQYSDKTLAYLNKMMPSVYVQSIDVPSKDSGFTPLYKFLHSLEYSEVVSKIKKEILSEEAAKKYDELLDITNFYSAKVKKLENALTNEIVLPTNYWSSKLESNPFGSVLNVRCFLTDKAPVLAEKILSSIYTDNFGFINLNEKDKKHLKVKAGGYIDAAYFLPKYYSLIKSKDLRKNGVFLFSDEVFTSLLKSDEWYGAKDCEVYNFSDLVNGYAPAPAEPGKKRSKDAWKAIKAWNFKLLGNWQKPDADSCGVNVAYNDIEPFIAKADKLILFPLFRGKTQICDVMKLKTTPFNKVVSYQSYHTPSFGVLKEVDEKVIVLSGAVASIQSCKLLDLGWTSAYSYAAKILVEKRKEAIENYTKVEFNCMGIFENLTPMMKKALAGTKFEKFMTEYHTLKENYTKATDWGKYFEGDSFYKCEAEYSELRTLSEKFEDLRNTEVSEKTPYEKAIEAYPLLPLFKDRLRSSSEGWTYKWWGSNGSVADEWGSQFVDYINMIELR